MFAPFLGVVLLAAPIAAPTRFTVGIELPSQAPVPAPSENAPRDIGIRYAGFYVTNAPASEGPETETTAAMLGLCKRLGLQFTLDSHHRNPSDPSVRAAAELGAAFQGVLIDELTHVRLLYPQFAGPEPDAMLADPSRFRDLLDAHYDVATLAQVQDQIVRSLSPDEMMLALRAMFPSLSIYEQTGLLGSIKAGAPPHVFEGIAACVRDAIGEDAWTKLSDRVGQ